MEIDIATLLENHRRHMLTVVNEQEYDNEDELAASRFAVMSAHDRATTKALLDVYRTSQGTGQPATATNTVTIAPVASRKVKAGSKKARDRAIKAGETRRRNLLAKTQQSGGLTPIAGGPIVDDSANREGGAA